MAKLFGACSPMVMCSPVMINSAAIVAITATASAASRLPRAGSIRFAIVGSPIAPRASEAIVIPSWQAARYSSSDPICLRTSRRTPVSGPVIRSGRADTSANSAATKNPLTSTSTTMASRATVVMLSRT